MDINDKLRELADDLNKEMEELGFVRLPVDADGEVIHIGDKLDGYRQSSTSPCYQSIKYTIVVKQLALKDNGWSVFCENGCWINPAASTHHKPTVEDVLDEFAERWCDTHHDDLPALKAKYADKLREVLRDE